MYQCSIDQQHPADVICSCQKVPLCNAHVGIHLQEAAGMHVIFPVNIYHNRNEPVEQFLSTNRESFERCNNFLKYERQCLEDLNKYMSELRSKIDTLKEQVCIQLDNVLESKIERVLNFQNQVKENIQQFKEKDELSRRTDKLSFDIETSVDELIDTFVTSIGNRYDIEYKSFQPSVNTANWVWSEELKGGRVGLSGNGKTAGLNEEGHGVFMVNVPMSEGKYSWKVKLDKMQNTFSIALGVGEKNLDLNDKISQKSFWGFAPGMARKFIKGSSAEDWGNSAKEGDIIGLELEFVNNKGMLSFSINGESVGVLCSDLSPPLYPTAKLYYKEDQNQISLVG